MQNFAKYSAKDTITELKNRHAVNRNMALQLLSSDIKWLLSTASQLRDLGHGRTITYSRKVFLAITNLCSDRCAYCGYRKEPEEGGGYIGEEEVIKLIQAGRSLGCTEALIMAGERPESKYAQARAFLRKKGVNSTVDYAYHIAELTLNYGLIPHINVGVLSANEMKKLKEVSASIGLMLESTSLKLLEPGGVHRFSPSKNPRLRTRMMEIAGKLRIPFTTGIILGIGERPKDIIDSIFVIKRLNEKFGHVQEVIIQPFRPEKGTPMEKTQGPSPEMVQRVIAVARIVLGPNMNIQSPPNLVPDCKSIVDAGANDLGGISPLTKDYVNQDYPWPGIEALCKECHRSGFILKNRLPIYPEFASREGFMSGRITALLNRRAN
ncbi:MAG: 7,8-didemethyl-8-hydroxy-5-deazariboflavin synthase CofG [Nitrososphaerota archaeon]|jgi:7,8-didemethyl-8-hydroxy-5-deazariboflavin synthase CofG subunit|nr:7,8-didemethyl-8-hydroxy-5-deazariboflavin synthase CofG [Nitrososphaerota archaeon]MDG7038369.1 7,8-didemethyl-8-hydroxy-5-deazariboflavin synthase CofG [Nitrososphaerota archaeon]